MKPRATDARSNARSNARPRRSSQCQVLALLLCSLAGCVQVDPETGETVPRGNQKYAWSRVTEASQDLRTGMSKLDALLLLGSPAEKDKAGDVWIYLPERPGVLLPASALRLEFRDDVLVEHGYHPIILGQRL